MSSPSGNPLVVETFSQAMWNLVPDPEISKLPGRAAEGIANARMGIGAIRYYSFYRSVRLREATLTVNEWRNPKRVEVDAFEDGAWKRVRHLDLPHLEIGGVHTLDLSGIETQFLRMACREHYPMAFPSMGDQWRGPHNPPYGAFEGIAFHGEYIGDPHAPEDDPLPVGEPLRRGKIAPVAPEGMQVKRDGYHVRFIGERFSVGFALNRPLIGHMSWDAIGAGKANINLIRNAVNLNHTGFPGLVPNMSGPHWRTLLWTAYSSVWGGDVSVDGNVVRYTNINAGGEVRVDATFTVRADGMRLDITQRTSTDRPTLELEAWRFVWDAQASAVASLAMPICSGRTGAVNLPLVWSAPGHGCLSCSLAGGSGPVRMQVDSHRAAHVTFAGIVLGSDAAYSEDHAIPGRGESSASFEFRVDPLLPLTAPGVDDSALHPAIHREWGSGLMFRPELAGFSNNALSTNCHCSQAGVVDLACFTRKPERGPDPALLARHTITMSLQEGRGYADNRDVYLDADPPILIGAGRVFMARPDRAWLDEVWPWIRRATLRHLAHANEDGLVVTPITTGNRSRLLSVAGDHGENIFLPSNAWDTVNFGHVDGYSNVETYRAFKNVLGLAVLQGDADMASRMRDALAALKANYERVLWNDVTGWLGSWRSRDGELHDYGVTLQNAAAGLYGLVSEQRAREIMARTEQAREALGLGDASYGFPCSLRPMPMFDQMPFVAGTAYRMDGRDAYGIYCNGTLTFGLANVYLWGLSYFGPAGAADRACREILDAHVDLDIVGGEGTGCEFHTHEGLRSGYEGAYVLQFPVLLAVAQHMGWTPHSEPRFWPAEAE